MNSQEIIFEIVESPEGGYEAHALGYSIFTQAGTKEELEEALKNAVNCHFDGHAARPSIIRMHIVQDKLIAV